YLSGRHREQPYWNTAGSRERGGIRQMNGRAQWSAVLEESLAAVDRALEQQRSEPGLEECGTVSYVGQGVARISGLPNVKSEEVVQFPGGVLGLAFNLE